MYYFYEGRTIKGMSLVGWALLIQTGAVIAMGTTAAALALLSGALIQNPSLLFGPLLGALGALCGILVAELATAIVFLVGFVQIYAGRHEYGLEQARSLERALLFLIIYSVLNAASVVYSASTALIPAVTGQPGLPAVSASLLLAPLGALFAGLTLDQAIRSQSDPAVRSRLRVAIFLGILGGAVGPALTLLAIAGNPVTLGLLTAGLVASALAGNGVAAISLVVFWLAYRETRQALEAGRPAPVLPRIDQIYPWLYHPMYPGSPPALQGPQMPKP